MRRPAGLFIEQAILFGGVVLPLALAEEVWWYAAVSAAAVTLGGVTSAMGRKPLLNAMASRIVVLIAFVVLMFEYMWIMSVPVTAVAHFMVLVCACTFLREHTLRDEGLFVVLCMLLLVVAAIVSGSVIFLLVLLAYVSVGLDLLLRFSLAVERARVRKVNAAVYPAAAEEVGGPPSTPALSGTVLVMMLSAVVVGVLIFALFPRVGAGMLGRTEMHGGGLSVSGNSPGINFETIGPLAESERQIMRVTVSDSNGGEPDGGRPLYLRGKVLDFYGTHGPVARPREWQRWERPRMRFFQLHDSSDGEFSLLGNAENLESENLLTQRYTVEPGAIGDAVLFTMYPAVTISGVNSDEIEAIGEALEDHTLRTGRPALKMLRYTIKSAVDLTPAISRVMEADRAASGLAEPIAHPPRPPLPEEAKIRDLIEPLAEEAGSLSVPANRETFAELVVSWLRSDKFTYTLSPPPSVPGSDPIGDFLLRNKRGYCQHFASAMVVACQLAGVPAHLVTGFRCDTYNEMGRFWSVRGKHAHAWVEVYIPKRGWVMYDPTPSSEVGQTNINSWLQVLRGYGDYLQFEWANLVLSYDAGVRRNLLASFREWLLRPVKSESTIFGRVAAFACELFAWRLSMSWYDRLLYWVFALLIAALTALTGYVVVVLSWRGGNRMAQVFWPERAGGGRTGDAAFYHRLCRRLAALGLRRRKGQTPAEFAQDLAGRYPVLRPAEELVNAHYEVVYGRHDLSPQRRAELEKWLAKLNHLTRATIESAGA